MLTGLKDLGIRGARHGSCNGGALFWSSIDWSGLIHVIRDNNFSKNHFPATEVEGLTF